MFGLSKLAKVDILVAYCFNFMNQGDNSLGQNMVFGFSQVLKVITSHKLGNSIKQKNMVSQRHGISITFSGFCPQRPWHCSNAFLASLASQCAVGSTEISRMCPFSAPRRSCVSSAMLEGGHWWKIIAVDPQGVGETRAK